MTSSTRIRLGGADEGEDRTWLVLLALVAANVVLWTFLPLIFEASIRLDVAEGVIGGDAWRLSYIRHPPFSTWLVGLASMTGPFRYLAIDLLGQVLAVGGLVILALFVRRVASEAAGAMVLVVGLVSPFATYVPIQVSHNIGLMPFWALALAAGWFAFERGRLVDSAVLGLAVGFGLWAKYAIAQLMVPLAVAFLAVPHWRQRLFTVGPWIAALLAAVVILPHALDVVAQGSTTISFATRTLPATLPQRIGFVGGVLLNSALLMLPMALLAALVAGGAASLWQSIKAAFVSPTRFDIFMHAAAVGPLVVLCIAALFGVRPRFLWLTPISLSFAAWWANVACRDRVTSDIVRPAIRPVMALMAAFVVAYVAVRLVGPYLRSEPRYPDLDARAFAEKAIAAWQSVVPGSTPSYIVSMGAQRGRQAAGSLRIELPGRPQVFENNSKAFSPWIDEADLLRRGALVVSTIPIDASFKVFDRTVVAVLQDKRPSVRGHGSTPVWFAIVPPAR